jgi:hypothetical protein
VNSLIRIRIQNSEALYDQNISGRPGGSKCSPEGSIDQVADSHHFAEEQVPEREKLDPDPH